MREIVGLLALVAAGCAAGPPPQIPAARHASNVAAAEQAGYKVVNKGAGTVFCPTAAATGSHMAATCVSETQFEAMLGTPRSTNSSTHVSNQVPGPGPGTGH